MDLRKALEEQIDRIDLLLTIGEAPRKPLFLVGQIGDQALSLHGERGRVVVETPDGICNEFSMEELGVESKKEVTGRREEFLPANSSVSLHRRGRGSELGGTIEQSREGSVEPPRGCILTHRRSEPEHGRG